MLKEKTFPNNIMLKKNNFPKQHHAQRNNFPKQNHAQRNNFPKQHHALTTLVRLLHRPKFKIFSTESNMMVKVVRYLPKSEAAIHRCLQAFTEKRLFISIIFTIIFTKVAGLKPKEKTSPAMFSCECLIFQNTFFANHVWVVTTSAKYRFFFLFFFFFFLLRRPHQQNVTLALALF